MRKEPLVLPVDGWKLEVSIRDNGVQVYIITNDSPPKTHYVRLGSIGSAALRDYLNHNMPVDA